MAGALGLFGGLAVAVAMMNISAASFVMQLRGAVAGNDILLGLAKSIAFGSWIAIAGCRIGLKAGRSATDVGHAANRGRRERPSLGSSALDALFDVCAQRVLGHEAMSQHPGDPILKVHELAFGYGVELLQHDVSFDVKRGSIFAIMGASGSGKSTLLKTLIGFVASERGRKSFFGGEKLLLVGRLPARTGRASLRRAFPGRCVVEFPDGRGKTSRLPLQMFTRLDQASIDALVQLKLSLVGLDTGRASMPSDLSGGMRQRVGLARALSLDPEIFVPRRAIGGA